MTTKTQTLTAKADSDYLGQEIEVEFNNLENPGLTLEFTYGTTKNFKRYVLLDGAKVKLPEKVVQHLESCGTPLYGYAPDGLGKMVKRRLSTKRRFSCRRIY